MLGAGVSPGGVLNVPYGVTFNNADVQVCDWWGSGNALQPCISGVMWFVSGILCSSMADATCDVGNHKLRAHSNIVHRDMLDMYHSSVFL